MCFVTLLEDATFRMLLNLERYKQWCDSLSAEYGDNTFLQNALSSQQTVIV
jgi:hypothetical protein